MGYIETILEPASAAMSTDNYRPAARIFFDPTIERLGHELVTKQIPTIGTASA
jgi:hypothetical protein